MMEDHAALRAFLHHHSGICLGPEKDYLFASRLPLLLNQLGLPHAQALLTRLYQSPAGKEASALISALATHETFWFRDPRAFDAVREHLLPDWRARGLKSLSAWSAACSTGQEIYSLAMLLADAGWLGAGQPCRLLASDICAQSVQQAREGWYSTFETERGLPDVQRSRHFSADGKGWRIAASLRQAVTFECINLLQQPAQLGMFELIFCRNVLIYFDRDTQASVLRQLHSRLTPHGCLVLGTAESPQGLCDELWRAGPAPGLFWRR